MAQDAFHFLNELPMWKLKTVASEFGIDVSSCRYKRDYIEKIGAKNLTEEQVRKALETAKRERGARTAEDKKLADEIEEIAAKPSEARELPEKDEISVERHIDEALTMKPSLFEVDSMIEAALNRVIVGDFSEAIKLNREARMKCLESFGTLQVYSTAVSIRAADELMSKIPDDKGRLDPNLRTAIAAAKRSFLAGSPRQREESLESLETLVAKTYAAFVAESEKEESELMELLADYESFGTRTEEARRFLQIAASAKQSFDLVQYRSFLGNAEKVAEQARETRAREIDNTFHIVRAAAAEASELGAMVPNTESGLQEARKAFDAGRFREAVELLAAVERATDSAHLDRLRMEKDLEARQTEKVKSTVIAYGPVFLEANSYGLDAREGMAYLESAKVALARRDVISAAKFARRVRELASSMDNDLHEKRVERGVIKRVDDAKCGKCGKESLYEYPNSVQKCKECGHSFTTAAISQLEAPEARVRTIREEAPAPQQQSPPAVTPAAPPPEEKKRKGLFRR